MTSLETHEGRELDKSTEFQLGYWQFPLRYLLACDHLAFNKGRDRKSKHNFLQMFQLSGQTNQKHANIEFIIIRFPFLTNMYCSWSFILLLDSGFTVHKSCSFLMGIPVMHSIAQRWYESQALRRQRKPAKNASFYVLFLSPVFA